MKNNILTVIFAVASAFCVACDPGNVINVTNNSNTTGNQTEISSDFVWDNAATITTITLNTTSISSSTENVSVDGSTATITKAGYYVVSGTLTNGQIKVNADSGIVKIKLNGVTMTNNSTSPFYIKSAKKVILFLADNTENNISDASSYSNSDEPNAAIFSNAYLGITGIGSLTVKGNYNDAISSDDQTIINNGNITVTAKDDGIRGKDYLKIENGVIKATAGTGHALKSDNSTDNGYGFIEIDGGTMTLSSTSADGIHAYKRVIVNGGTISIAASASQGLKSDSLVVINGGTTLITASREGIESPYISIKGGNLSVTASDDGLNATFGTVKGGTEANDNSMLEISGGYVAISATGGDGMDSNGNVKMTGGTVVVHGPKSQPEVGIDYNGTFNISGGLLIASGTNSNMTQATSTSSSQNTLKIAATSSLNAGTLFNIQDASGNSLVTFKPERAYYSIIFSSPSLVKSSSYSIYTGGTSSGTLSNGLYTGGTYTGGTLRKTFTVSSSVTSVSM
jgi:hypothetical protein